MKLLQQALSLVETPSGASSSLAASRRRYTNGGPTLQGAARATALAIATRCSGCTSAVCSARHAGGAAQTHSWNEGVLSPRMWYRWDVRERCFSRLEHMRRVVEASRKLDGGGA